MERYEQIARYISEGDEARANELLRAIMLDTARTLYEELSELEAEEEIGGDASDDLIKDVEADEETVEESGFDRSYSHGKHLFKTSNVKVPKAKKDSDINNRSPSPEC